MDKDVCINRVLRDMKLQGLISEEANGEVKIYLNAVWVAGYEHKTKELGYLHRKGVIQYDANWKEIRRFEGIKVASIKVRCDNLTIERAIKSGKLTRKRHYWKLAEDEKGNDRDINSRGEGKAD